MKHPNARINHIHRGWYISLGNGSHYLSKSGGVIDWHDGKCTIENTDHLIMHKTREDAQATLDKYNNPEPTLAEVKEKLSKAQELVGKKIKVIKGDLSGEIGSVTAAYLTFDATEFKNGPLFSEFMGKNGYAIALDTMEFRCLYDDGVFKVIESISVKNHNGEEYFAQQCDEYWQFGCAKISKQMIKDCLKLFENHSFNRLDTRYSDGNRNVIKVTIGAADFDFDTLKKLVDADNNKA